MKRQAKSPKRSQAKSALQLPLLSLLSRATEQERRRLVADLAQRGFDDLALAGARVLGHLQDGPLSIQALAVATATTKQFTAREVKRLEQRGYVNLSPSEADGRVTLVALTERGRALLSASTRTKVALEAQAERRLGAHELATLRRLLTRLTE
jgi:DNA-binding MarR family transcriptional regulator